MVGASILVTQSIASSDLFRTILQWAIGQAKKPSESWADFFTNTDNRRKLLRYAWLSAVLVAVVISVIAIALSAWIGSTLRPGIVFVVFVWAICWGVQH